MLNQYKILSLLIALTAVGAGIWIAHKPAVDHSKWFATERAEKRSISHIVTASGNLEIKDLMKIGSNNSGLLSAVHIEEGDQVSAGQLLAEVDPGTGDVDLKKNLQLHAKARCEFQFLELACQRQQALYKSGQLALETLQKIEKDLLKAQCDLRATAADLEKAELELSNRKIIAPASGTVTTVYVHKGESVTGASVAAMPLFEIAPDVTCMNAVIDIDESDVGAVQLGQKVTFAINAMPDLHVESTLQEIAFSPKSAKDASNGNTSVYRAVAPVCNKAGKLRPGMALHGSIFIAQAADVHAVKNIVFQVKTGAVKKVAAVCGRACKSLDSSVRPGLKKQRPIIKFVWVATKDAFVEKAVTTGVSDGTYTEIKSGLDAGDEIITSIHQSSDMDELYKKWFKKVL